MRDDLVFIASHFSLGASIDRIQALGAGFINDTFVVYTHGPFDYILQKKNSTIFIDIPAMMENIEKVTNHLKAKIRQKNGNPDRETLTVVKTKEKDLYFRDKTTGEYWTVYLYIDGHLNFDIPDSMEIVVAGGVAVGAFQSMLSDFPHDLTDTLPGFHNIEFRFKQWDEALAQDPKDRKKKVQNEITWIESRRLEMLKFWNLVFEGTIPRRIAHNDTKLSNILFDENRDVICLIDLDTVQKSTVLFDFGDAIRSYANTGKEDDTNLEAVGLNLDVFKSFTAGYLQEAQNFLTRVEVEHLAYAAKYITFEQVLRYLCDYINGDIYYKVQSDDHNLIRTRAQYKLLRSLEELFPSMEFLVEELWNQTPTKFIKPRKDDENG